MPMVKIKDVNALLDNKLIFDQLVKKTKQNKKRMKSMFKCQETMIIQPETKQIISTGKNHYKPIGIDLSRRTNTSSPQKINFIGKLEEDNDATMFFITEKQQKSFLNF